MIRKSLLLSVVITASAIVPITSNVARAVDTKSVNLCVAYDLGGPGDRSYNDAVLAGLTKAKKTLNFNFEGFITDGSAADREKRLRAMITKGCSPILAIGSGYAKLLTSLAMEFPTQQFSILSDASIASLNVTSLIFNDKQVGYLAGAAAARVSKTGKIALISNSTNLDLEAGFKQGANSIKKKVKVSLKSAAAGLAEATKEVIGEGNDVIFAAINGSVTEIFEATVKYNESKKKSAAEVGVITIEPDQYLTVTSANQKYLLGAISKRVDNAILDLVTSAIRDQQISDILDPVKGIYGRSYGITGGNIELSIWAAKLNVFKASLAAASRKAAKL
jgi:basic membrane protein A and related proteins